MEQTKVAQAVNQAVSQADSDLEKSYSEGLEFSPSSQDYEELKKFSGDSVAQSESESEGEFEEMTGEDSAALSSILVGSAAEFVESCFESPVTIDNETREIIAAKAQPVVLKYSNGKMPPWLVKYREEIELIGVLAIAGLSIYKQVKLNEKQQGRAANDGGEHGNQREQRA